MRRWCMSVMVLAGMGLGVSQVSAQTDDPKEQFISFEDMEITGTPKTAEGMVVSARTQLVFERRLRLKKSFLPHVEDSAKTKALK